MKTPAQDGRDKGGNVGNSGTCLHRGGARTAVAFSRYDRHVAEEMRDAASEPGFLAGVLEHMLGDENLLIAFADNAAADPADIARARQALGGR